MKSIDIVVNFNLNTLIGPTGTIRRIMKNKDYFASRGYAINLFSKGNIEQNSIVQSSRKNKLKSYIKELAPRSFFLSALYMYKIYSSSKPFINNYLSHRRSPEIAVFHSLFPCYQFLRKNINPEIRTIMFLHSDGIPFKMNFIYFPKLKGSWVEKRLMKIHNYVIENIDKVIFISKNGYDNFINLYPNFDKKKVSVIVNGIDDLSDIKIVDRIDNQNHDSYNLVCSGTINSRKGQEIIIESLIKLKEDSLKKIHVTFIGDGSEKRKLEEIVKSNALGRNVTFLGKVSNDEVQKYLSKSDIFILMSKNEGLPISIIEAMRSGLPVITTNNSGMPEVVKHHYNGLLIEPDVNQLTSILNNIEKYEWCEMGRNSRKRFESEFTFDRMKKEYCDMLDSII